MKSRSARETPMMKQFLAIKANQPDAIVFYRMGDFYEMFMRDAEIAAPLLDIALTTRDKGKEDAVPMCGVPVHAADAHIKKLASLGHRVAICEQVENPTQVAGKRLVKREVVEVVTPGLVGDPEGIEAHAEVTLAALDFQGEAVGLASLEASTGECRATRIAGEDPGPTQSGGSGLPDTLLEELRRVAPRELLLGESVPEVTRKLIGELLPATALTSVDTSRFEVSNLEGMSVDADLADEGLRAAAAVVGYLRVNQPFAVARLQRVESYRLTDSMVLDAATRSHLELFRNREDGGKNHTLIACLDLTSTPLGARKLARWLAYPLLDLSAIEARHGAVAWLSDHDRPRARLREALRPVRDLERLYTKAVRPNASPRDLAALRDSLEALPEIVGSVEDPEGDLPLQEGSERTSRPSLLSLPRPVPEVAGLLREALVDEPAVLARGSRGANETGYIREAFHHELDRLRGSVHKGRETIAGIEARERERTGIATLKVRFHPVHGYSLEVSKTNLSRVPDDYERKQTLANVERFTTPELRDAEQGVLHGTEHAAALEREILEQLRLTTLDSSAEIAAAAEAVARLDTLASLSEVARRRGWVRPLVDMSEVLEIVGGRHPVLEDLLSSQGVEFVPNDASLDPASTQMLILTGPNMSGKSTYLRQVALIALLVQIGSFVPAESARVGVVDRIFTRVGASDNLSRGESTFMVEMRETAEILAHATRRSLVILDEIGRGTSTYDGLSIAWAVAEHLHDRPELSPRTLFATHYHELTDLAHSRDRIRNGHFEAREWGEEVVFLRQLVDGGANRSYGIHVARLAGLPDGVIERSRELLGKLETGELLGASGNLLGMKGPVPVENESVQDAGSNQLGLFNSQAPSLAEREVLEALRDLNTDEVTPLQALQLLAGLAAQLNGSSR
ncbi:DNA mismatch repair protein MutS [Myxococcota bacterium]|nr:DNA mismatch repair protein MutS [Myxococcota bacterium]